MAGFSIREIRELGDHDTTLLVGAFECVRLAATGDMPAAEFGDHTQRSSQILLVGDRVVHDGANDEIGRHRLTVAARIAARC